MKKIHLILILILSVLKTIFSQQLFPHIVWLYWKKGYEHLGGFQKLCLNRVISLHANTDWEVRFLDQKRVNLWLNKKNYQQLKQFLNPQLKVTEQTRANFIRYYLLKQHGGVWLDVSIVLFQNLNWLDHLYQNPRVIHKNIFKKPEIFLFYKHQGDISQQKKIINYDGQNIYPLLNVQNSMIAAIKQSQFMNDLINQYKMLIRPNGRKHFYSRKMRYHFSYAYSPYFRAFLANNIIQFKKFSSYLDQAYEKNISNISNKFYGILTMNRKYQMYHLSQKVQKMTFAFESQGSRGDYAYYFAKYHHFSTQQVIRNVFSGKQSNIQKSQKVVYKSAYLSGQQYLSPQFDCLYKLQIRQDSVLNKYLLQDNKRLTNDIYPNIKVIENKNLPLICKITVWKTLRKISPILQEWTKNIFILFVVIQFFLQYLIFSFKSSQMFITYFQGKERFKSQTFRVLILLIAVYLQKDLIYYQYQLWLQQSPTAIRTGIFESIFTLFIIFWISFESSKVKNCRLPHLKSSLRKNLQKFWNFQLSFCLLMLIQYFVQYSFTVWKYDGEIYNYEILTDLNRQKLMQGEMHLMKVIAMTIVKLFIQLLKFVFRLYIKNDIMIQQQNHICKIEDGSQITFFQQQPNCFVINHQKQNSF